MSDMVRRLVSLIEQKQKELNDLKLELVAELGVHEGAPVKRGPRVLSMRQYILKILGESEGPLVFSAISEALFDGYGFRSNSKAPRRVLTQQLFHMRDAGLISYDSESQAYTLTNKGKEQSKLVG